MIKIKWIRCPIRGNKTRDRIREDMFLKNYPLYCPKCRQGSLIDAKDLQVTPLRGLKPKHRAEQQIDKLKFARRYK